MKVPMCFTDVITLDELPQGKPNINLISPTTVEVVYNSTECSMLKGPLFLNINYQCADEWCNNKIENIGFFSSYITYITFTLDSLIPYSDYKVVIEAKRNEAAQQGITMKGFSFKTLATGKAL